MSLAHEYPCRREALMFYIVTMRTDKTMKTFKDAVIGCFKKSFPTLFLSTISKLRVVEFLLLLAGCKRLKMLLGLLKKLGKPYPVNTMVMLLAASIKMIIAIIHKLLTQQVSMVFTLQNLKMLNQHTISMEAP
ncbi:PREDICTED: uncharacterized protein LOC104713673 [Camelina sativa]|uniref:Uncharacterized protein LOC104713673 n=1 Tax=Camelina sativa TaxID=90675 RepID=A0ABM0TP17_CAMSA|nr:PREDICTED: uncharacterized protein LOC104713673 [Camelina sativa]